MSIRLGNGLDVHPFTEEDRPLILAGVHVPDSPGLEGHSDADVVAHALTDALLGAVAAGDIGGRFGVDAEGLAGAESLALLAEVAAEVTGEGWRVGNVDCTVVAQWPRLSGYRTAMRERLAGALSCEPGVVSVKFTTTDHLGSLGRGEGIACWATVLLEG